MLTQTILLYVLLSVLVLVLGGGLINVTVDDQFGDSQTGALPEFLPSDGWAQGNICSGCGVQPDPSQAFHGTWHDTTLNLGEAGQRTFNVNFTGTAVYTFFIIPDTVTKPGLTILANMTITLDGEQAAIFVHVPDNTTGFLYNSPGYVNENLANTSHQLSISANAQVSSSLILFDYLIYTTTDTNLPTLPVPLTNTTNPSPSPASSGSSSPKSPQLLGPVLGGVLGGVVFGFLLALLYLRFRRRRLLNTHRLRELESHPVSFVYTASDAYGPQASNLDASAYSWSQSPLSPTRRALNEDSRDVRVNTMADTRESREGTREGRRKNRRDTRENTISVNKRTVKQKNKRSRATTNGDIETTSRDSEPRPRRPLPVIGLARPSQGKGREREIRRLIVTEAPPSYSEGQRAQDD
ncbi:hypothetical protein EW145_g6032 [Phellinidium pouzarii]|uniref:Uncharacterized protein n=1 Tax=Phellinidium pouzarii TaxID=167371 RepID=A0A4S4L2Q8_9AGAM|nr:hypothetical protein EW145_g6032 [Phellinidium pouzarii]